MFNFVLWKKYVTLVIHQNQSLNIEVGTNVNPVRTKIGTKETS